LKANEGARRSASIRREPVLGILSHVANFRPQPVPCGRCRAGRCAITCD
jgi:hypothetical protein